jgi:YegS/Rv2252/BmrU family lipid kinase
VRAVIVCNPRAGRQEASQDIARAAGVLMANGWTVDVEASTGPGDATRIADAAVRAGSEAVLAAGGDGTLNEVVQALAGTETRLGYLPYGTVNIWARETGIPLDPAAAAHAFVDGRTVQVDLGRAGERYFLLMAGLGFDAEVVRRERALDHYKRRFGVLPYAAAGVATVWRYRGADVELRYDGLIRRVESLMVIVGNTRLYGGFLRFTPNAVANDGWLDLCILKGNGVLALLRQGLPLLATRTVSRSDVEMLRVRELTVRTERPFPMQLDGELAGSTPVSFGIAPRALHAVVPREFGSDLIP